MVIRPRYIVVLSRGIWGWECGVLPMIHVMGLIKRDRARAVTGAIHYFQGLDWKALYNDHAISGPL